MQLSNSREEYDGFAGIIHLRFDTCLRECYNEAPKLSQMWTFLELSIFRHTITGPRQLCGFFCYEHLAPVLQAPYFERRDDKMNQTYMKEKPVLPLLLSMSLPMVISMLVNSLYNIVDSFFVAQISEDAMTALS